MRWLMIAAVLLVGACQASAGGDAPTPAPGAESPFPRRSRAEVVADMRRLQHLAVSSDRCGLNERIVASIVIHVGAALFVSGTEAGVTAADRNSALVAGADDARREQAAGRPPACDQVAIELVAIARQYVIGGIPLRQARRRG